LRKVARLRKRASLIEFFIRQIHNTRERYCNEV
jgi:hypothetical protein